MKIPIGYDKITVYAIHIKEYYMRRIHKMFLSGCGYAILILILFYAFAAMSGFNSQSIAFGQFALILTFGFIISLAEFMYEELKVKKLLKCLIHYGVLLMAFYVIFILSGNIAANRAGAVFVAVIIYTALYFILYVIVHFTRRAINRADDHLDRKTAQKSAAANKKSTYKSLYGGD